MHESYVIYRAERRSAAGTGGTGSDKRLYSTNKSTRSGARYPTAQRPCPPTLTLCYELVSPEHAVLAEISDHSEQSPHLQGNMAEMLRFPAFDATLLGHRIAEEDFGIDPIFSMQLDSLPLNVR